MSLLVFEQNAGALTLYEREGFGEVDRAAVVPHPLINHTGDVILMIAPVSRRYAPRKDNPWGHFAKRSP